MDSISSADSASASVMVSRTNFLTRSSPGDESQYGRENPIGDFLGNENSFHGETYWYPYTCGILGNIELCEKPAPIEVPEVSKSKVRVFLPPRYFPSSSPTVQFLEGEMGYNVSL